MLWRRRSTCEADRLRASVATEREASARTNQQVTSLAELSARFQQQLDSSRANDEHISESLRQHQWTEAQIATLMSPSRRSLSSTSLPALMSPSVDSNRPIYALSGDRGTVGTPAASRGSLGRSYTFQARRLFARLRGQRVGHRSQSRRRHAHCRRLHPPQREGRASRGC